MNSICVAYLVRKAHGIGPFQAFIDSYRRNAAGLDHDLLLILKGFNGDDAADFLACVADVPHRFLRVPDRRFDIGAYDAAICQLDYECFTLFNSFSVILAPDWLKNLHAALGLDGVGAVGATASCESVLGPDGAPASAKYPPLLWLMRSAWRKQRRRAVAMRYFAPFPNPHLRTNAFMIRRDTWLKLQIPSLSHKIEANAFEAGRANLTRQLERLDRRVLIVDRLGRTYEQSHWSASRTFRSGDQQNLLVADNRTRHYASADPSVRRELAALAWGDPTLADL